MSAAGFTGRLSAAAIALGLSLGGPGLLPGTIAVAAAEPAEDASVSDRAAPDTAPDTATAPDTGISSDPGTGTRRVPKPRVRGGAERTASPDPAADTPPPDEAGVNTRQRSARRAMISVPSATDATPPAANPAAPVPADLAPSPAETAAAPPVPGASAVESQPAPAAEPPTIELQPAQTAHQSAPDPGFASRPVNAAPRALATVSTPAGAAATSFTDTLEGLLGPIQALFEGAALLVRRTLFNEAPTVSPVQLTGQSEGPITGTIGAVDPEGDPLSYTVTSDPRYGTVSVTPAGGYTYTPGPDFTGTDSFAVTATDGGFHLNLLNPFRPAGTSASVPVSRGALAALLRFQFVYGAGSQYWSPEARGALETAARDLGAYLVVSSPVTITYAVTGEYSPLSATLASAGSDFVASGAGFQPTVVQQKIQTGADANGTAPDGTISWNFGPSWGFGTVASTQYDFQSIAMHELVHTLGLLSNVDQPGANAGRTWTEYDSYLVNSAGNPVIGPDYVWNTANDANLTGGNGGLYLGGPNAVAANRGPVRLHTPDPWASGSSVSHLAAGSQGTLMTARINRGPGPRTLGAVELAILRDLGYTVAPGPGGATLMFVGVLFLRRPRKTQPVVAPDRAG